VLPEPTNNQKPGLTKNQMKFYIFLLNFTLFSLLANAQFPVRGSIRDEESNELLVGATITFNTGEKTVLSNEKGEFNTQLRTSKTTIKVNYWLQSIYCKGKFE
jgi:hypothetical protein